uniref:AXH domain-containing protein n=1 Tax=Elaeophora elaphi TaxID=1147741 RepID=A0A0R3S5E6_9BILA
MNGAPGGSRQSQKAPPEGGPIRQPASIRTPTQQQPAVSVAIFPQQNEAGPSCQPSTVSSSQAFPSVMQQSATLREPFPMPHAPAVQHPMGWPAQFEMQTASSQVAAGLRYSQPSTSQQPPSGADITMGVSPLSSLPSPSISSASLLTGIGLSPGSGPSSGPGSSSGPEPGSSGQSPLQMLGAMNPALLAQYQVLLAAIHQHQAATLAVGGRSAQIGSRVGPPSTPTLTLEQNLQRHLLQLQQQQQLVAPGTAIHLLPSSPLHPTLMAQMHAALTAFGVLPQSPQSLPTHTTAQPTHQRVTPAAVTQSIPSLSAETSSRPPRVEFIQPQPLLSRVTSARQALLLASTSHAAVAAATVTTIPTPSASALQLSTSQPYSQALGRVVVMPPPAVPRLRHIVPQDSRRYAPYQRPTLAIPLASAPSVAASAASTGAPEPSSFQVGTLPSQPYYPSHFMRGTVIRLQSGQLKRVEEMSTEDFVLSAAMKTDLVLCNSRVIRIQEIDKDRQVLVTFAVGEQRILVTIEAGIEHPYFVVDQGWASCSPERTRATYGLICRQLNVGDVCIALRHVEGGETSGISGRGTTRSHSGTRGGSVPSTSGIQQFSRPAPLIQALRRHPPSVIRTERRPGVRSAPSHETPTEELALLDIRRRLRRRRHKSAL